MVRRQLATIVFWQATTVAVVAITAGIPLGIAAGRAIWRALAISLRGGSGPGGAGLAHRGARGRRPGRRQRARRRARDERGQVPARAAAPNRVISGRDRWGATLVAVGCVPSAR